MKNTRLTALLLMWSCSTTALAQTREAQSAQAMVALEEVRHMAAGKALRTLGFESVDEARASTLGEPLPVFLIRLDELQRYEGDNPARLLTDLQRVVYPVRVAGEARSLVELQGMNGRWETARVGGVQKSRLLDKGLRAAMRTTGAHGSDFFEVRIPALQMVFLGHHGAEGLLLIPLLDDASLSLEAGRPESAQRVLSRLVPRARATPSEPAR